LNRSAAGPRPPSSRRTTSIAVNYGSDSRRVGMIVDWPTVLNHLVHDVRSLARKGITHAQLLEREMGDSIGPDMRTHLLAITSSQKDLTRLMEGLRGLAESTSTGYDLLWNDVQELETVVLSARIQQQHELADCVTVVSLPAVLVPLKMHAVIGELLRNAIQFRPTGRQLEIRIQGEQAPENRLRIQIEDNGEGWDPMLTDRLFQPFQRLSAVGGGFGLGLSIARGWVESAGGRLVAESTGSGARFTIELPFQRTSVPADKLNPS
ncbi:MAG: ATP-binding protein, partial [Acidobacteriota bacterium]